MAYRLKLGEPLARGVRRIALEQIDRILDRGVVNSATWIHETRKSLKRTRALLRLVRPGLARDDFEHLNAGLRDVGRLLSAARDRDVRTATAAALAVDAPRPLAAALARVQPLMAKDVSAPADPETGGAIATGEPDRVAAAQQQLLALRGRLEELPVDGGMLVVEHGLARSHRQARKALTVAREQPSDEAFHELRKCVQLHWRQMQLLSEAWPDMLKARIGVARSLAQLLGNDHDYAMLVAWIESQHAGGAAAADCKRIVEACQIRQAEQRGVALGEAGRLFMAKPDRFAEEIRAFWEAAATDAAAGGRQQEKGPKRRNRAALSLPSRRDDGRGAGRTGRSTARKDEQ